MTLVRRLLAAIAVVAGVAGVLRLRGTGGRPPAKPAGGWRLIESPDGAPAAEPSDREA